MKISCKVFNSQSIITYIHHTMILHIIIDVNISPRSVDCKIGIVGKILNQKVFNINHTQAIDTHVNIIHSCISKNKIS